MEFPNGKGFVQDGSLHQDTEANLQYVARKPGWFVPVSDVLDRLRRVQSRGSELSGLDCLKLELRYIPDRFPSRG